MGLIQHRIDFEQAMAAFAVTRLQFELKRDIRPSIETGRTVWW